MQQGLSALRALKTGVALPYYLALLADMHRRSGQVETGLTVLSEAMTRVQQTGEQCWGAELYRLRGELLLARSEEAQAEAETCFQQALTIARDQQANAWELRAATSLARLWQSQGKRREAHDLLASVYAWFTEGFATVDLREAKALLEVLRVQPLG